MTLMALAVVYRTDARGVREERVESTMRLWCVPPVVVISSKMATYKAAPAGMHLNTNGINWSSRVLFSIEPSMMPATPKEVKNSRSPQAVRV